MKRREFIGLATLLAAGVKIAMDELKMKVDGAEVTDEEKDVAKEAIAIFAAAGPADGAGPDPKQVAEKGRLAIRAWRELGKG